ncbi:ATP-binding protein [uncultured Desulfuromusa sp.]|uniref:PAS domain-containing sensor histidine kinase n=1 Tax=uncultured Desulfuromusa sp. TaxID=219183 RepID=UPI002AA7AD93|nr:ATP-binding protein [uncultured Desulfuromusa sp.]
MVEQNHLFLQALEISPNPMFLLGADGKVILWNHSCEEFTGYKSEDIVNTERHKQVFYPNSSPARLTLADIILTNQQSQLVDLYPPAQNAQMTEEQLWAEGWYTNLGGKDRYISFSAVPLRDKNGMLLAVLETFHDMTEQRQDKEKSVVMLEQVRKAKLQWEQTMDRIDDLILCVDTDENLLRCNWKVRELLEKPYSEIIKKEWRSLLQTGGIEFNPVGGKKNECYHPQTKRWFLLKTYKFHDNQDNSASGAVITLQDQTETRQMTTELEQAHADLKATQGQILQSEKMAAIGQLAAGVAHEINNPIGFVTSNLRTLGRYVDKLADHIEEQEKTIHELAPDQADGIIGQLRKKSKIDAIIEDLHDLQSESLDGLDRISKIVKNLKSFSRVDQTVFSNVDLNECLESTLNIVWNELKYTATIEKKLSPLPLVPCYPQEINQVFLNLLVNAGHAIGEKGVIRLYSRQEGETVCISITDNGCGIPEENLKHLFEPFFTTKEVGKGTGLGLSISYDIIQKHNGEIQVESEVGKGTTFTIRLPLQQGDNKNNQAH